MKREFYIKNLLTFFPVIIPLFIIQCNAKDIDQTSNIIARIGKETITTEDLDHAIEAIPGPYRYEYKSEQAVRDLLQNMIDWKLMAKEAVKIGLDREADIQVQLRKVGDFSENKREQVLADAYIQNRLVQQDKIVDEEISDYYLSHQEEFKIPERVRIKRIFFSTESDAKMGQEKLEKGMSFEELMEQNRNLRKKVATLWLHRRDGNSEMEKMAFNLSRGEVSNIFMTKAGYCLLRIEEKAPPVFRSFKEVKEGIRAKLKSQKRRDLVDHIKRDLRKNITITINQPLLKTYQIKDKSP